MLVELGYYYGLGFFIILDVYMALYPKEYFIHSTNLRENPDTKSASLMAFARVKFAYLVFSFAGIFTAIWGPMILVFLTFFKTNLSPAEIRTRSIVRLITYMAAALIIY